MEGVSKEWKGADIMPVYKSGKKELLQYKPILLVTSIVISVKSDKEPVHRISRKNMMQ